MNKKRLLLILKILVSLCLITWLLYKADLRAIWHSLKGCSVKFFALIYLSIIVNNLAQVFRWHVLLANIAGRPSFPKLLQFHMIGNFFQGFLPSSMSVDIVKGYLLSKTTDPKKAYGSLLFGRIMGITVLFSFFLWIVAFRPQLILHKGFTAQIVWALVIFMTGSAVVFSKKVSRFIFSRFERLSATAIFRKAKAFREELYNYRYDVKAIALAALLSAVIFMSSIISMYFSFRAVHFHIPVLVCMIYVPIIFAVMLLPVSINGIGLREGLMLMFFAPWGLTREALLSSSVLAYAVIYSIYLLGGIVYLFSGIKGVNRGEKEK
jgi:glycosyltransferase 2 family protein